MTHYLAIGLVLASLAAHGSTPRQARWPVVADAGGCQLEQLTDGVPGETHFQFEGGSHDGHRLFVGWSRGDESGSYILDLATGERRETPGLNNAGVFSRDGTQLLVANTLPDKTTEIVEYDIASAAMTPIAPHPRHEFLATYSADQRLVLFNSYRSGRSDIYVAPRAGGEAVRLTDFDGYEAHAALSPDMKSILFHRKIGDADYDIYRIDFATRAVQPFIVGPGEQAYPSWSPDGRYVAFASDAGNAAGKADIHVAGNDGAIVARITAEPGYNSYPSWSKSGGELYFNSERNGVRNVFRVLLDDTGACLKPANGSQGS